MSESTDAILFRQKLYEEFLSSGLIAKLQTELKINLLDKINHQHKKMEIKESESIPFHLKNKFIESIVIEHLINTNKENTLSVYMAECNISYSDCLKYEEISEITYFPHVSNNKSFLYRMLEEYVKASCFERQERSSQTDFSEPLSKKFEDIDNLYKPKIDYWKLIPSKVNIENEGEKIERLLNEFKIEKEKLKNELEFQIKKDMEKKYENQYLSRMREVEKQHEGRLNEIKNREKELLRSLEMKKNSLEEKAAKVNNDELKMINKYEIKMNELEKEYKLKLKEIEKKEKEFWKKELELKAKKREYEETIELVKEKIITESTK